MGWILVKSVIDQADPANSYTGESLLGLGAPLTIAALGLLLGIVLMVLQWRNNPAFFRRKREAAAPDMRL